jgi:hypothetical protein
MTWLLESPWPALTMGVVVEIVLAIVLVRTGRPAILIAMGVVFLFTAGMLIVELWVVTEGEAIEDALDETAAALEANDTAGVLARFTPASPRRGEVERALDRFHIRDAHVGGDLEFVVNELTIPPSCRVNFTGRVEATDSRREIPYEHLIRRFRVTLHRDGNRWLIHDYAMEDPTGGGWAGAGGQVH